MPNLTKTRLKVFSRLPLVRLYETGIVVAVLLVANPSEQSLLLGLPLTFVGIAIRTWTRGYAVAAEEASIHGPYRFVRHPHHLGTFLMLMGYCVASRSFYVTTAMLLGCIVLFRMIFREERLAMGRKGGVAYKDYYHRVPTLIPNLKPYKGQLLKDKSFSLGRSLLRGQRREFESVVAAVFIFFLMYGLTQMTDPTYWRIGLGVCAGLYGVLSISMMFKRQPVQSW